MVQKRSIIQICVALCVLLLPLAHLKVVIFGLPLYSVEMPILVALGVYFYGWWEGEFLLPHMSSFRSPLVFGTALFVIGAILSFVANPFSWTGLGMLKTWFAAPLCMLWLWLESRPEKKETEKIVWAWFGAVFGVAVLSSLYAGQGLFTYDGRLAAWYQSPNYLAFFLASGPLLVHYLYFHLPAPKTKIFKPVLLLALVVFVSTLFFTHSYATWVSVAVAGSIFLFFDTTAITSWRKKLVGVFLLGIIFVTFIFFESGSEKWQALMETQQRSSFASREIIWQVATRAIIEHPFLGIGVGRFQDVYLAYQKFYPPYLEWAVPQPHNLYLAVWVQTGLVGLLGFVLLVVVWFKKMLRFLRILSGEPEARSLSALFISLLALYLIIGLVDTPFFRTDLAFIFWLILGLGIGLTREQRNP